MNYSSVISLSSKNSKGGENVYKANISHSSTPSKKSSSQSSSNELNKSRNAFEIDLIEDNEKYIQDSSSFMDK